MKPRIVISGGKSGAANYEKAIAAAGGEPTVYYCPPADAQGDALLLCGGEDVDPAYYHQELDGSEDIDLPRDRAEFAIIQAFLAAGKPILGVCRGHQIMNVALGGSLLQDVGDALRPFHAHAPGADADKVHPVRALPGSFFEKTYGSIFAVNSSHHQAVDVPGDGLLPALWSESGVVEGMVHERLPILCVQFHPERMSFGHRRPDTVDGAPIFQWLMEKCR